jgi:hypothetical protein
MDDHPNSPQDKKLDAEAQPSMLLGAFEFMAENPFDLVVLIKPSGSETAAVRRIELYYAEGSRVSSFVFDRTSAKFGSNTQKTMQAAIRQLIEEVKSRTLARHEFNIWYYSAEDQKTIEREARAFAGKSLSLQRYLDVLYKQSRLIEPRTHLNQQRSD